MDLRQLNEFQREAVLDESSALLVKANVGSGKTTVLIEKILYLFEEKKVPLRDMAVLTFTNKAAREIRERLLALRPNLTDEELSGFGTFHSVARNLLKYRLPVGQTGWSEEFVILSPEEETEMALRLIQEHKLKIKYKNRLQKRLDSEYAAFREGKTESRYRDELFTLFSLLQEEKKRQDKMAFSDLIEVCTELLKREAVSFQWVIVDEVQDSDQEQVAFISALMEKGARLFAVGDPNQLIYSWRGSVETVFYLLKHRFSAKELSLPINYRSSGVILEASQRFLQYGTKLSGTKPEGELVRVRNHYDPFQEAEYLSDRIQKLHQEGVDYGEIAVFYRLQSQSEILEKTFSREGIPFTVSLKKTLSDIPVLEWFMKVLLFSVNPRDRYAAEAALTNPVYGFKGKKEMPGILEAWEEGQKEQPKALESTQRKRGQFAENSMDNMAALYQRMRGFWEEFSGKGQHFDAELLYTYFDLDRYLWPNRSSYPEDRAQVIELCQRLVDYSVENKKNLAEGTKDFLSAAALYGIQILKCEENPGRDKVRLMTLHASKGLEFTYVFLIGVNQGLIPLGRQSFESEEEERRLFFVGLTRAREHLELSYYTNPGLPGATGGPGRYLQMLPEHLLDWEGRRSEAEKRANLQELRNAVREEMREAPQKAPRKARHPKYGIGTLTSETELILEVDFPNYGKKEFLKAFGEVELLDE